MHGAERGSGGGTKRSPKAARRALRHASAQMLALALVVLVACGTATTSPARDASMAPTDAAQDGLVQIGEVGGAIFTPWHDGSTVLIVHGPQGGVMVTPNVAIDGAAISGTDPMLTITLTNESFPGPVPLEGFTTVGPVTYPFTRIGSLFVSGQLYDQIGWVETPGQSLRIGAHVQGPGIDATTHVRIVTTAGTTP